MNLHKISIGVITDILQKAAGAFLDAVYPSHCPDCGTAVAGAPHFCPLCLRILTDPENVPYEWCPDTKEKIHRFSCYGFSRPVQRAVHMLKYENIHAPSQQLLRAALSHTLPGQIFRADMIVPVPLHWRRFLRRGYNQSRKLADTLSGHTAIPVQTPLRRRRATASQTHKNRHRRMANMKKAFICCGAVEGASVLLVDDVMTTGATLHSCAAALRKAGAEEIILFSLAGVGR
ncbi:MAG: ComF family protein [Fibrobacterota bacterium]